MEADGVWAVGRAGGEDAGERGVRDAAGVDLQRLAVGLMEPGEEDELVSEVETEESVVILGIEFEPGFGGVLVALTGGGVAVGESGADGADGVEGKRR